MCRDRECLEISLSFGQIRIAEDSVSKMTLVTAHHTLGFGRDVALARFSPMPQNVLPACGLPCSPHPTTHAMSRWDLLFFLRQ